MAIMFEMSDILLIHNLKCGSAESLSPSGTSPADFVDPLTFHPAPPAGQIFHSALQDE